MNWIRFWGAGQNIRKMALIGVSVVLAATIIITLPILLRDIEERRDDHNIRKTTWRILYPDSLILELYYLQNGQYPLPGRVGSSEILLQQLTDYKEVFQCFDNWGNPLFYYCTGDGQCYWLLSVGKGGTFESMTTANNKLIFETMLQGAESMMGECPEVIPGKEYALSMKSNNGELCAIDGLWHGLKSPIPEAEIIFSNGVPSQWGEGLSGIDDGLKGNRERIEEELTRLIVQYDL